MKKYLFFIFVFIASLLGFTPTSAAVVNYTADNTSIFRNPERGFTEELSAKISDSKNHLLVGNEDYFEETYVNPETGYPVARPTETLVMLLYNLYNYKTKDLSAAMLQGFDEDMQVLRDNGFKCVLRFAYTENISDKADAQLLWAQRHISQLKPHLIANADVIYVIEAGFVGVWGEWYYTNNYGNESQHMNANRRALLDTLLKSTPQDRFVLVRYPMIKTEFQGDANPITYAQSFSGITRARIGYHNDAFLNVYGDMGTYASDDNDDDPAVRQYIADETLYVPNGGETNVEDDDDDYPNLSQQVYSLAPAQMSTYHWSFCGESYAVQVTNKWHASGIFDELNRNMGYRYQLVTATLPDQAAIGGTANINIQLKNVGYAPLYNERHAYLVLKNGNNKYSIQLQSDPRRWLPNDVVTTINEQITIPSSVPAGTYQLYLHLPDKYASLASDPRFAVRFANTGVWDATTGMNDLGASITIVSSGTVIPTTPTINVAGDIAFGDVTIGTEATQQLAVSGNDLEAPIFITSNNAALTVNPTSLTPNEVQSAISVTLTLNATVAGSGSATLTLTSTNAESRTVNVTWTAATSGGGDNPGPSTPDQGQYSVRTYSADSIVCTWNFVSVVSADQTITTEIIDNGIIYRASSTNKLKVLTTGLSTQKTQGTICIPVPEGAAGTISATMWGNSDGRWFQLYVNNADAGINKRIWSKFNATVTSDNKRGPQSFTFTASDLTKIGDNYYLVLIDNTTEMKVATFTVTLTTGTYAVGGGSQGGQGGDTPGPTPHSGEFVIDGNFSDWSDVTGVTGSAGLFDMRWYANSTDIYFYLEFDATTGPIDILLNTDNNSATGHDAWMWSNAGADWLIEGESDDFASAGLSSFDNTKAKDDWDNGWVLTSITDFMTVSNVVTLSNGHKAIEGKISMSKLGTVSGIKVGVFTNDVNWNDTGHLPTSASLLDVPINTTPTGIDQITNLKSQISNLKSKILHQGVLYIIRDGKIYNAQGALIAR